MYIEVHVDESTVLENLSDDEILEEANSRGLVLHDDALNTDELESLRETLRYKGSEAAIEELSTLIYTKLGKMV